MCDSPHRRGFDVPECGWQLAEIGDQFFRPLLPHDHAPGVSRLGASRLVTRVRSDIHREMLQGRVTLDAWEIMEVHLVKVRHDAVQNSGDARPPGGARGGAEELDQPPLSLHKGEIQDCAVRHLSVLAVDREKHEGLSRLGVAPRDVLQNLLRLLRDRSILLGGPLGEAFVVAFPHNLRLNDPVVKKLR